MVKSMSQCVSCKGRGFCGRPTCPILRRLVQAAALPKIGMSMEGFTPPEVFVGRHGYPAVRAGPMMPADQDSHAGADLLGMDVGEIIALRSSMVRSEARVDVKDARRPGRLMEAAQNIAMSSMPVGAEVSFLKEPSGNLRFDGVLSPAGPSAPLSSVEITTNPVVPRKVDQFVEDRSVTAADAISGLFSSNIDIDHISRLLSLGLLGQKRKLVPTRWSITASDDQAGISLTRSVLDKPLIEKYQLYSGEVLGNHFEVLLMPEVYSFELIEIWMPRSVWSEEGYIGSDREGPLEKKEYSPLAGGYYAARLAVLEHLARMGRQASVLAVREITPAYWAPLGVWVVREAARQAMRSQPKRFGTLAEAMSEMEGRVKTPSSRWRGLSRLISEPVQTSLLSFLQP